MYHRYHQNLNLEENIDILNYVSNHNSMRPGLVIGFAAETDNHEKNAEEKLNKKNCDWIIANDVSNKKIGFDSNYNEVKIFKKNKSKIENISYNTKEMIAKTLVKEISNELKVDG